MSSADSLKQAFRAGESEPPEFAATLAAAERRMASAGRRRRTTAAIAAVSIAVLAFVSIPGQRAPVLDFALDDVVMTSTYWHAPSDVLLAERPTDLFSGMPALPVSTQSEVETL